MGNLQASIVETVNSNAASTWVAGHNSYFDNMEIEDIDRLMGTKPTPEWMKLDELDEEVASNADIPDTFDARTQWPGCDSIKEVRDQANCGSCWAFGAVEAISDRICIASGQKSQVRISSEDLLTCCGFSCGSGCNGGYTAAAWRFFVNTGLVTGDLYGPSDKYCRSYTLEPCDHHVVGKYPGCQGEFPTPACVKQCDDKYTAKSYAQDKVKGISAYSLTTIAKIKQDLLTYGSVEASFTVYEDFLTYKSGVYVHTTGAQKGGHAIKIIGWGVENDVAYWLCANSWNEDWGMNGFFKIKQGTCGIDNGVVAGRVPTNI